jgi:glycosyltransferase involved in cell wall biosynthesis
MQTYENKELIVINDESNVEYKFDHPSVKIYNIEERFKSLSEKRNFSRNVVNGDYIFVTDDDDIFYRNHVTMLLKYHLTNNDYNIVFNKICHYSEHNMNTVEINCQVAFNGSSIKREYYLNNSFPSDISCGEDQDFIKNAKIFGIYDEEPTYHIRWGNNIHHISGMGGDGKESYKIYGNLNEINEQKIIEITPKITELTLQYFK